MCKNELELEKNKPNNSYYNKVYGYNNKNYVYEDEINNSNLIDSKITDTFRTKIHT